MESKLLTLLRVYFFLVAFMSGPKGFCDKLKEGIADEAKASPWYGSLALLALRSGVTNNDVLRIDKIKEDERTHHSILLNLKYKYCKVK
jgi:hypothetical protein